MGTGPNHQEGSGCSYRLLPGPQYSELTKEGEYHAFEAP
jgi:hypothetical protein